MWVTNLIWHLIDGAIIFMSENPLEQNENNRFRCQSRCFQVVPMFSLNLITSKVVEILPYNVRTLKLQASLVLGQSFDKNQWILTPKQLDLLKSNVYF